MNRNTINGELKIKTLRMNLKTVFSLIAFFLVLSFISILPAMERFGPELGMGLLAAAMPLWISLSIFMPTWVIKIHINGDAVSISNKPHFLNPVKNIRYEAELTINNIIAWNESFIGTEYPEQIDHYSIDLVVRDGDKEMLFRTGTNSFEFKSYFNGKETDYKEHKALLTELLKDVPRTHPLITELKMGSAPLANLFWGLGVVLLAGTTLMGVLTIATATSALPAVMLGYPVGMYCLTLSAKHKKKWLEEMKQLEE